MSNFYHSWILTSYLSCLYFHEAIHTVYTIDCTTVIHLLIYPFSIKCVALRHNYSINVNEIADMFAFKQILLLKHKRWIKVTGTSVTNAFIKDFMVYLLRSSDIHRCWGHFMQLNWKNTRNMNQAGTKHSSGSREM